MQSVTKTDRWVCMVTVNHFTTQKEIHRKIPFIIYNSECLQMGTSVQIFLMRKNQETVNSFNVFIKKHGLVEYDYGFSNWSPYFF